MAKLSGYDSVVTVTANKALAEQGEELFEHHYKGDELWDSEVSPSPEQSDKQ